MMTTETEVKPLAGSSESLTLRILVVENHPDTLESIKYYLEDLGHKVSTAMTIAQATRALESGCCDVLLCDIGLPDGNGWEVMQKISSAGTKVFGIAMSGFGMNADSVRSREAGFRHHLLKPFKGAELDSVLMEAATELAKGD